MKIKCVISWGVLKTLCVVFIAVVGFIIIFFVTRYESGSGNALPSWNVCKFRLGRKEDNLNNDSSYFLSVPLYQALD